MAARGLCRALGFVMGLSLGISSPASPDEVPLSLEVRVDAGQRHQRMEGFGVNVTPAQWRDGALKPTLDLLVKDLGSALVRLDCYGKAERPASTARTHSSGQRGEIEQCECFTNSQGFESTHSIWTPDTQRTECRCRSCRALRVGWRWYENSTHRRRSHRSG